MLLLLLSAAAAADSNQSVTGTFDLALPPSTVEQRLDAAIDRALEPMSYMTAKMARGKLEKVMIACDTYETALDGETFTVRCDNKKVVKTTLDGSPSKFSPRPGKTFTVTGVKQGDAVVDLTFHPKRGAQTTRYDFSGSDLVVTKTITSPLLEVPVSATLTYQ